MDWHGTGGKRGHWRQKIYCSSCGICHHILFRHNSCRNPPQQQRQHEYTAFSEDLHCAQVDVALLLFGPRPPGPTTSNSNGFQGTEPWSCPRKVIQYSISIGAKTGVSITYFTGSLPPLAACLNECGHERDGHLKLTQKLVPGYLVKFMLWSSTEGGDANTHVRAAKLRQIIPLNYNLTVHSFLRTLFRNEALKRRTKIH